MTKSSKSLADQWPKNRPFSKNALDLFYKRYAENSDVDPEYWLRQVAAYAAKNYKSEERETWEKLYGSLLSSRTFLPTSAALINSQRKQGAMSGCIVLPLASNFETMISESLPEILRMLMLGIGVGLDLSHLTPRLLSGSTGLAMGPVNTLLSICQALECQVLYGGAKRAAFMATLHAQHPDIFSFIAMKQKEPLSCVNISVSIDYPFSLALKQEGLLPLYYQEDARQNFLSASDLAKMKQNAVKRFAPTPDLEISPNNKVFSREVNGFVGEVIDSFIFVDPKIIMDFIAKNAHACGDPGIINLQAINEHNPTHPRFSTKKVNGVAAIRTTTPCGEQPLLPYEVCHLGSLNLSSFVKGNYFDEALWQKTARLALRFMDDLISLSDHGLLKTNEMVLANRKIGIGIMGLADALAKLELAYDSAEALQFSEKIASLLQEALVSESEALAKERGAFLNFSNSKFKNDNPRRHATLTTIAPTGHIATLADCSFGIEPFYLLKFSRRAAGVNEYCCPVLDEKLQKINYSLQQWIKDTQSMDRCFIFDGTLSGLAEDIFKCEKKNACLSKMKKVFKTAHELNPDAHLTMVKVWQKYVDNGVSKTINLPSSATHKEVSEIFMKAIKENLKGLTIFRDQCLSEQAMSPSSCVECVHPDLG